MALVYRTNSERANVNKLSIEYSLTVDIIRLMRYNFQGKLNHGLGGLAKLLCVGLFGTCGSSKWRDAFMKRYAEEKIEFYNPQIEDWKPEYAEIEAAHLAEDSIILFPITGETYGTGSLAETGFSVLNAIRLDDRRDFVIMIEQKLNDSLDNEVARKESLRARALVKQHLKKLRLSNLYVVDSLEEMLEISITLFRTAEMREPLKKFNPHTK